MDILDQKMDILIGYLKGLGSVVVAFSGGTDSTFLVKTAFDTLGDKNVLAVTAKSSTYPTTEISFAIRLADKMGIRYRVITSEELDIPAFRKNPPNRCYYCKIELFTKLKAVAAEEGLTYVVDGSNYDDTKDLRPGMDAARELGIKSPLIEAMLTKSEIRQLSKKKGIETWNKPSFACLSSRFPYGDEITLKKLAMIEKAEACLRDAGFTQYRVRHHGDIARIEVPKDEFNTLLSDTGIINKITSNLKQIGFLYITLDLQGYRSGSMNEKILTQTQTYSPLH